MSPSQAFGQTVPFRPQVCVECSHCHGMVFVEVTHPRGYLQSSACSAISHCWTAQHRPLV
eukprot:5578864-Amphidinium_carterae.1